MKTRIAIHILTALQVAIAVSISIGPSEACAQNKKVNKKLAQVTLNVKTTCIVGTTPPRIVLKMPQNAWKCIASLQVLFSDGNKSQELIIQKFCSLITSRMGNIVKAVWLTQ